MVLYDARSKRALTVVAVERETNAPYMQVVVVLREKGIEMQSIIVKSPRSYNKARRRRQYRQYGATPLRFFRYLTIKRLFRK